MFKFYSSWSLGGNYEHTQYSRTTINTDSKAPWWKLSVLMCCPYQGCSWEWCNKCILLLGKYITVPHVIPTFITFCFDISAISYTGTFFVFLLLIPLTYLPPPPVSPSMNTRPAQPSPLKTQPTIPLQIEQDACKLANTGKKNLKICKNKSRHVLFEVFVNKHLTLCF